MSEKYKNLKVKELQELLQKNGIPHSGKKEDLIERLVKDDERKALEKLEKEFELDDLNDAKLELDLTPDSIFAPIDLEKPIDIPPVYQKESVLSDDEDDFVSPVVVKSPPPVVEEVVVPEKKPVDAPVPSSFKFTPITYESKNPPAPKKTVVEKKSIAVNKNNAKKPPVVNKPASPKKSPVVPSKPAVKPAPKPVTIVNTPTIKATVDQAERLRLEAERKLERSKRFGIKLDEKEMKEIRAARFGITHPPPPEKKKEETIQDKLKKRAERFGIPELKVPVVKKPTPVKKTPLQKAIAKRLNDKSPLEIKAGRIKKNTNKKVTKNNILNRKYKNVNTKLTEAIIAQKKKNIVNNRKVNIQNNNAQGGRIVTFQTKSTTVNQVTTKARTNQTRQVTNTARQVVKPVAAATRNMGNGRTVVVNTAPKNNDNQHAKHNQNTRKRGRGFEPPHPVVQVKNNPKKKRRNDY